MPLSAARALVLLVLVCALPASASAQSAGSLKLPTIAASAAAAADWASTYHALKYYRVREVNPLLRPFDRSPSTVVWLGAAIDAGAMYGWHAALGREHPRIAATGLWAMTAFRAYLAIHNLRNEQRAARR